jgi:hypothetical protein
MKISSSVGDLELVDLHSSTSLRSTSCEVVEGASARRMNYGARRARRRRGRQLGGVRTTTA